MIAKTKHKLNKIVQILYGLRLKHFLFKNQTISLGIEIFQTFRPGDKLVLFSDISGSWGVRYSDIHCTFGNLAFLTNNPFNPSMVSFDC
jgi:hypothetical protein